MSHCPEALLETGRSLPIGFWKGAGLCLLLDIRGGTLSCRLVTHGVSSTISINPYMDTAYGGSGTNVTAGQLAVAVYDTDGNPGNGIPPAVIPPADQPVLPEAPAGEPQPPTAGS